MSKDLRFGQYDLIINQFADVYEVIITDTSRLDTKNDQTIYLPRDIERVKE